MRRERSGRSAASLALGAVVLALATQAAAQGTPSDAEHERGLRLLATQRPEAAEEALRIFQGIYARTHEPRALWRAALAESELRRWGSVEAHMREVLAQTSDPWVSAQRAGLESDLARVQRHFRALELVCNAPGARAFVNDQPVTRVPEGDTRVTVRAEGYQPQETTLTVRETDSAARLEVTLTASTGSSGGGMHQPPPPPRGNLGGTLGWVGVVGGGSLVVGGAVMMVLGELAAQRWNGDDCLRDSRDRETNCGSERSTAEALRPAGAAVLVAGGLLAAGGVLLWLLEPGRVTEARARPGLRCGPSLGVPGALCEGSF
ncbi:MAG: hypothetical protein HY909_12835 [Deltaproteobacteria bacterium]|nr:hypothetical protein [Deltaproteobacteria bacterium]